MKSTRPSSILSSFLLMALLLLWCSCATEFKPPAGVTIPSNFEEANVELDRMFNSQQKAALRSGDVEVEELLLTFGMQLKEYWGLWQDSKMAKFMHKNDVDHPDQMITVIFNHYITYLRQQG